MLWQNWAIHLFTALRITWPPSNPFTAKSVNIQCYPVSLRFSSPPLAASLMLYLFTKRRSTSAHQLLFYLTLPCSFSCYVLPQICPLCSQCLDSLSLTTGMRWCHWCGWVWKWDGDECWVLQKAALLLSMRWVCSSLLSAYNLLNITANVQVQDTFLTSLLHQQPLWLRLTYCV